jgi:hypothetical protein
MRSIFLSIFLFAACVTSFARIGETPIQFIDRYGAPKDNPTTKAMDKKSPLVEGAVQHHYEYQGWKIHAAFLQLDGPAVRMDYSKLGPDISIKDYELQAIASANTPSGLSWRKIAYDNADSPNKGAGKAFEAFVMGAAGNTMWQRSDGAILWLRSNIIVRLELPTARETSRPKRQFSAGRQRRVYSDISTTRMSFW